MSACWDIWVVLKCSGCLVVVGSSRLDYIECK